MFTDPFTKATADEIKNLLARLDRDYPDHGFRPGGLMVLRKNLSFYPDAVYYDLTQADGHPARHLSLVVHQDKTLILGGQAAAILQFNQTNILQLDRQQVIDYARFYLAHVVGPHGISYVIDTVEDLQLEEEPTPGLRKTLHDRIVPFALNASLPGGGYQLRGSLLVERTLYSVLIDINLRGETIVHLSRVLADVLPVVDRIVGG